MDIEAQYKWMRRGKKYKANYMGALKELYGRAQHDKDVEAGRSPDGGSGTDSVGDVAEKAGD